MYTSNIIAVKAASVLAVAGFAAAVAEPWGWPAATSTTPALATITPCTEAPSSLSVLPITVTSQYQPVSTCTPVTACMKGSCMTSLSCDDYLFVSTTIPCWNGTGPTSTLVTETDQMVTVSNWATTVTSYVTPTASFKHMKHHKPTPIYSTIAKAFCVPYSEIGDFVLPSYPGSGICGEECAAHTDGSKWQELNVTECHSGPQGPSCVQYVETWISAPVPATTAGATGVCSSHAFAPSAGTWTFTFPFTAPPPKPTDPSWPYSPEPWFWEIVKECDGPSDWVITTTVTKTITFTVPASTQTPTSTWKVPFPTDPSGGQGGFPGFPWASSIPTSTSVSASAQYIQVYDSGVKYYSSTPKYIGFSNDDGIIVTDEASASLFYFENGELKCNGETVGADSAWGYQPFQKYESAPNVYSGWSLDGSSGVHWNFGSGSASFCVTSDDNLFVDLTSSPPNCKPVDLMCGGAAPTSTSSYPSWTSTTSSATADPSSDWTSTEDSAVPVETEWSDVKDADGGWRRAVHAKRH